MIRGMNPRQRRASDQDFGACISLAPSGSVCLLLLAS